jgi:hypothetical protein
VLAAAVTMSREDPLVGPAMAGTETDFAGTPGNGPIGYFPDRLERGVGEIEPLPRPSRSLPGLTEGSPNWRKP